MILRILLALTLGLFSPLCADQKTKTLDFTWIDSEGGGSTLIVTPAGESILIDTGNPGGRDSARILAAAKDAGLTRIDHVLITHWHVDHFGGAAEVAQQIPIGILHVRALPEGDPDGRAQSPFPTQIKPFKEIAAKREPLAPGIVIPLKSLGASAPKMQLRCLAADQKFVAPTAEQQNHRNPLTGTVPPKEKDPSDNANSAVFVFDFGPFRFFDGGDLTWNLEEKLVTPYNLAGVVDVYQTDHHGLEVSNNPLLLQSLAPTVVVMNNGPKKGGQPGTFAAIQSTAKTVQARYQIHKSYNVTGNENVADEYIANQGNFTGADAAKCTANVIKMSVAADGKSYTIAIPANHHSRTFKTKGTL